MTVLITGSRGKTARPLTEYLSSSGYPVLIASRNPSLDPNPRIPTVRLDWHDPSTYDLPFAHPLARRSPIDRVYLVGDPTLLQPSGPVLAFVERARERGVNRFVLLSAWEVGEGEDVLMGPAHKALREMGEKDGVEWSVLRPQFFMENFAETYTLASIRNEHRIYSGADEGRVAFVSAQDIAAVAYYALTDQTPHNTDHIITGAEALTYDEIANIFSDVLGHKIEHKKLNQRDFESKLRKSGHLSKEMVQYMIGLDDDIACGRGGHVTNTVQKVVGRRPKSMREFITETKDEWE